MSRTVPGFGQVGLERQRSLASTSLRAIDPEAAYMVELLTGLRVGPAAASR